MQSTILSLPFQSQPDFRFSPDHRGWDLQDKGHITVTGAGPALLLILRSIPDVLVKDEVSWGCKVGTKISVFLTQSCQEREEPHRWRTAATPGTGLIQGACDRTSRQRGSLSEYGVSTVCPGSVFHPFLLDIFINKRP